MFIFGTSTWHEHCKLKKPCIIVHHAMLMSFRLFFLFIFILFVQKNLLSHFIMHTLHTIRVLSKVDLTQSLKWFLVFGVLVSVGAVCGIVGIWGRTKYVDGAAEGDSARRRKAIRWAKILLALHVVTSIVFSALFAISGLSLAGVVRESGPQVGTGHDFFASAIFRGHVRGRHICGVC